jgi:hypothetical protein
LLEEPASDRRLDGVGAVGVHEDVGVIDWRGTRAAKGRPQPAYSGPRRAGRPWWGRPASLGRRGGGSPY